MIDAFITNITLVPDPHFLACCVTEYITKLQQLAFTLNREEAVQSQLKAKMSITSSQISSEACMRNLAALKNETIVGVFAIDLIIIILINNLLLLSLWFLHTTIYTIIILLSRFPVLFKMLSYDRQHLPLHHCVPYSRPP